MPATGGGGSGAAPSTAPKAYHFDAKAYAKAVMHACKHASQPVSGVFIGSTTEKAVKIVDAVPLFHTHMLAPMLKVAFMLIEQYCQEAGGLEIVGLYYASASGALEMGPVKAVADKVVSNCPAASVWTVDSSKLAERKPALCGYFHAKDEWKLTGFDAATLAGGEEAVKHASRLISELKYMELVDVDDHLSNATLNWLNPSLFKGDAILELPAVSA
eukprot:CAMPEP_0178439170 /NCGR_PEP_ID=MMETSP0689_2-20121128/36009_1 /TAXON_ID=160604 /ORGANISM="Amphidinium massartii, Strain CS-259" /LENGTH=215 /DNA_ID=CAMNT_0020061673 /DNA_START=44 /DNA_END=688 /DNA_ORIENTATION=-